MASKVFTARQAARVAGVSYSTIAYWDRTRFLQPSVQGGKGSRGERIYSYEDLVALRVAHQLRQAGISLQSLRRVVRLLGGANVAACLAEERLVTDGRDLYERRGAVLLSRLRNPGQGCLFQAVEPRQAAAEVQEAIAGLDEKHEPAR
jgi:DNA-binding transcriptional MerR regulator